MKRYKEIIKYIPSILVVSVFTVLIVFTISHNSRDKIVKIDSDYLIKAMVRDIASQEMSKEEIELKSIEMLARLDKVIHNISVERKVLVIPKAAVIAGGVDITDEVLALMETKK